MQRCKLSFLIFNQFTKLSKFIIRSLSVVSVVYSEKKSSIKVFEILEYFFKKFCNDIIYIDSNNNPLWGGIIYDYTL